MSPFDHLIRHEPGALKRYTQPQDILDLREAMPSASLYLTERQWTARSCRFKLPSTASLYFADVLQEYNPGPRAG